MTQIKDLATEQTTQLTDDWFVMQTAAGVTKKVKATNMKLAGYEDVLFIPTEVPNGSSAPTLTTFRGSLKSTAFTGTGTTIQEIFGAIHLPHNYVPGTDIYLHIHWSHIIASPPGS